MKLPAFLRRGEQRDYTDSRVSQSYAAALGNVRDASRSAALEVAAGWWGRGLSVAEVADAGPFAQALDSPTLMLVGRELCRRGEALLIIDVDRTGAARLIPACDWTVRGGDNPASWTYSAETSGPDRMLKRDYTADAVVHLRYAVEPTRPWRGLSPLACAPDIARLTGLLDSKLGDELQSPVGSLIPTPEIPGDDDNDKDPLGPLRSDIEQLGGGVAFPETFNAGAGQGRANAPQTDWMQKRIGAAPTPELVTLQGQAASLTLSACGVPPALAHSIADAASRKEALRQFLHATLQPLAEVIQAELRVKLEQPDLRLTFDRLFAADVRSRAQAYGAFVAAGMSPDNAARIVGVDDGV